MICDVLVDNDCSLKSSCIVKKYSETPEQLQGRISTAKNELERLYDFDYVVVNAQDRLDDAVNRIQAIIEVEHLKVHPRKIKL